MDVEPTIDYALESHWTERLLALGYGLNDPVHFPEYLVYNGGDWAIHAHLTGTQVTVLFSVLFKRLNASPVPAPSLVPVRFAAHFGDCLLRLMYQDPKGNVAIKLKTAETYACGI